MEKTMRMLCGKQINALKSYAETMRKPYFGIFHPSNEIRHHEVPPFQMWFQTCKKTNPQSCSETAPDAHWVDEAAGAKTL